MKGVIVSNATPIIAFSRISKLDLFRQITGEITIPQEVSKELYEHGRTDVPALNRSNWIKTRKVKSHADVELLLPSLDKGEAEVIVLSKELGAGLVIIDELTARKVAIMMGLPVIGAVGLLIHAKKTGLIKPKLSDSGNRVNLGQDMKELDHTVWHDIKKRGGICLDKLIKIL